MLNKVRIYSYASCTTCKRALKWLSENNIDFEVIDIVVNPPSRNVLIKAIDQLENRKKIFNTSGLSYRNLGAKRVQAMSDEEAIDALLEDGKLIKRPFLISKEGIILVGFKAEVWTEKMLK